MNRFAIAVLTMVAACLAFAPAAGAEFGFKDSLSVEFVDAEGNKSLSAGAHPFAVVTKLEMNSSIVEGKEVPDGEVREIEVELPPGFIGDPFAVPHCSNAEFLDVDTLKLLPACPNASAVGVVGLKIGFGEPAYLDAPVYNLNPPPGVAAKFGFIAISGLPVTIEFELNPDPPYNLVAHVTEVPQAAYFYGSELIVWGNPADDRHDALRGNCLDTADIDFEKFASVGECHVDLPQRPMLTLPRSCSGPLVTHFTAIPWHGPPASVERDAVTDDGAPVPGGIRECAELGFSPKISAQPTSRSAESPSGLDFELTVDDPGLGDPDGRADSDIRSTRVTLPEGVTVNPSQAEGLGVCTEEQLARETSSSGPGEGCPQSSKIGSVEVESAILEGEILRGSLFVAEPYENRFGSLVAIYMTIKHPERGISLALAGRVELDPRTGQLVTTFADLPQVPVSEFRLRFHEGGRSPLVTPPTCGSFQTAALMEPWSSPGADYSTGSSFEITSGPGGGPCPAGGTRPFAPGFEAGSLNNAAGAYSPFYMQLTRRDGEQEPTRFSAVLPPGLTGKIAGIPKCPEAAIAAAKSRTGREELAFPSCPAASQIGRVLAGAGVGSELTYVPGRIYLAGPVNGAPLSAVVIVPAVAGPFDVGTVVVREALNLNPVTAEVQIDGAASDPIPHILAGIPLRARDIRVFTDRPEFTLNPTSCAETSVNGLLWGGGGDPFSVADDVPVPLRQRFQAADCASLDFKPRLAIRLKGPTKRTGTPALQVNYRPRPGDANLRGLALTFPRSAFLEQGHIRTICTRVQYAADACPAGSIYGHVRAWTPLLDEPLEGPVYLRASNNPLPDAVFALKGVVEAEVSVRVDSVRQRLRATVESAPDVPVSLVEVRMQGGSKGLFVNSRNICEGKNRGLAKATGQNGRRLTLQPRFKPLRCKGKRTAKRSAHRRIGA